MKLLVPLFFFSVFLAGCQTPSDYSDNSASEAFEKNSQTVLSYLEGFQKESLDYAEFSKDMLLLSTTFGETDDSISLNEVIQRDKELWANYDFEIVGGPPALLPGVSGESSKPDGSVRYYAEWKVTRSASDNKEAKSASFLMYESFDFDADGKIAVMVAYGDFTGLMMYLNQEPEQPVAEATE